MDVDEQYKISAAVCLDTDETLYFIELQGMRFLRDTGEYLWFEKTDDLNQTYAIERKSIVDICPD